MIILLLPLQEAAATYWRTKAAVQLQYYVAHTKSHLFFILHNTNKKNISENSPISLTQLSLLSLMTSLNISGSIDFLRRFNEQESNIIILQTVINSIALQSEAGLTNKKAI